MSTLLRKISWLVLSAVVFITAIGYLCPMSLHTEHPAAMALSQVPSLCQSLGSAGLERGGTASCLEIHLAAMAQLLGDVPNIVNSLLALALITVAYTHFFRDFLIALTQPLLNRFRHRYVYYRTSIKFLIEKGLLHYLNHLGTYTVASIS